jgi:glutathione peroxidase
MPDVNRRTLLAATGLAATGLAAALGAAPAFAQPAAETVAWNFSFPSIEDGTLNMADYRGRVLLVANTASFCGFTYQYEDLEKLHAQLGKQGLTVIGMPSQDFNQESGTNAAVKAFCDATFDVQFPMTGLTHVRGPQANAFYKWVKAVKGWEPDWNFNKVLIGRDGRIIGTFGSSDAPFGRPLYPELLDALRVSA